MVIFSLSVSAQKKKKSLYSPETSIPEKYQVDTRIDNMGYWRRMAKEGLVPVQPKITVPVATRYSAKINGRAVTFDDSEDVPVTDQASTQSENSIFIDPSDNNHIFNSNNSTSASGSVFGANDLKSDDGGDTWYGHLEGTGGGNSGDPSAAIGLDGRMYSGFIHSSGGQGVAYSEDNGDTWTSVLVGECPSGWGNMLDKNHMWIDNCPTSQYEGNIYSAWTSFGGTNDNEIEVVSSGDGGLTWSPQREISSEVNAGSHNQGVNLSTGPNGEVYAIWSIYDSWPIDENAIGMARSFDGGDTWETYRIIEDIRGIRNSETGKNMRVNSFPSMDVDISSGSNSGTIYVTWANIGTPGENTGNDMDVYMIKSTDNGTTWSDAFRVNQDPTGLGKQHYFPWVSCDPISGTLSVIYYDDRNVSSTECEVFVSNSSDGGDSWEDNRVSDIAFTPSPIPGLATGYMGDYLGIDSHGGIVYPTWADNRSGTVMTYVSPFLTGPPPNTPWVVYESHNINDAAGNNNDLLDFGETISFGVAMHNIGDQPSPNVNVTLTTASEYITINDATENYGDMDVDETISLDDIFNIDVNHSIPDGTNIAFILTATDDNDSTFISGFSVEAHAPALVIGDMTITETIGDMNGFLDPGESATVSFTVSNPGSYSAETTIANLATLSEDITIVNAVHNIGDISAGENATAEFDITVSEEAEIGATAELSLTVNSEYNSDAKNFFIKIGVIVEDWESEGFESFAWQNESETPWQIVSDNVYEGSFSAKSGNIGNSATTTLSIAYAVMNDDVISFYRKVSTENNYDYLKFYIDDDMVEQWAGDMDWEKITVPVTAGEHTFSWTYYKDTGTTGGEDCVWIDYIEFPAPLRTTASAGADQTICVNNSVALIGEATLYESVNWTTAGTGDFDDAASMITNYNPSQQDYDNASVELTFTSVGPEETISDVITINFTDAPNANAGENSSVCANDSIYFNNASADNYSSLLWLSDGDGEFTDNTALQAAYHLGNNDIIDGEIFIRLISIGIGDCLNDTAFVTYTVNTLPSAAYTEQEITECQNTEIPINITLEGASPWNVLVEGTDEAMEISEATHTFNVALENSLDMKILEVQDANGCVVENIDTLMVNILPAPQVELRNDTSICHNHTLELNATAEGNNTYFWTPGEYSDAVITIDSTGIGMGDITYSVIATGENGCETQKSVTITFEDCTGIPELLNNIQINIYPNPSNGQFVLLLNSNEKEKVTIFIADQNGKKAFNETISVNGEFKKNMSLTNLSKGVYMMKIINNKNVYTQKIVIRE